MHICSGIARHLRNTRWPALDIYHDKQYVEFQSTIDAEMKRLQHNGLGNKRRQAEPLSEEDEEILWNKGLLWDHSPQSLLNTMVFMNGLYFALRSGRELRSDCSQIEVVARDGERAYRISRKHVTHHANVENPSRCFVHLLQLYRSCCPDKPKRNSFYLRPLSKPTQHCWYSREPLGHNTLANVVCNMCKVAGITGFYTNHSLPVLQDYILLRQMNS